ncbi:DUF551 domain-containing protein [Citrobacter freundii]|nr:DUF551 domain-containing protein [Citrobacter freundii]EKW7467137.1 DUF551 domain-containing protein [Citrobacter freundii]
MTTFTKEQLIEMIKRNITVMDRYPDLVTAQMDLEVYKIALASLEAEPVAYIFKHPAGKLFWALTDESNKEQADVIPVYAAAPASVVPDNASEPLAYAYKELTPEIMRNHLAVFERYGIAPNDSSTTIQALRIALDGIERSDAMLQSGNFRENKNSSTNNFREIAETSINYPVIPDSWISCSERMPAQDDWILIYSKHGEYMAGQVQGEYVELNDGTLSWLGNALYWMPLPDPPQEVK